MGDHPGSVLLGGVLNREARRFECLTHLLRRQPIFGRLTLEGEGPEGEPTTARSEPAAEPARKPAEVLGHGLGLGHGPAGQVPDRARAGQVPDPGRRDAL